jgi:hypothetical protein
MLQLANQTPFSASIAVLPNAAGIDTLYVIVKGASTLRPKLALAEEQVPVTMADEYYGDPASSSLKLTSEMHIGKLGTDVLLVGQAWALDAKPVTESLVSVKVAERNKLIRVRGDRVWQRNGSASSPEPFESMPLTWERAFGGMQTVGDRMLGEERNPVGAGFLGERKPTEMEGLLAPNLEDPKESLERLGQLVTPVCFAPIAPSWLPRRSYAGTYDDNWQRQRAPYLPDDFDSRFFQCATPELCFDRYLQGGEPIEMHGVTPEGPIAFTLPSVRLVIDVVVAGASEQPVANLETVLLEPDANRVCFTWRAALLCDRKVLKVEKITVSLAGARSRT